MAHAFPIDALDLTPPDNYEDLQIWLRRNFELIQNRVIASEVALTSYDAQPARANTTNLHGGLVSILSGAVLVFGSAVAFINGISKLLLMPTAGTDFVGNVVVTGTIVDRVTGVQSPGQESIPINWSSPAVDNSIVDANGNTVHRLVDGIITENWFVGITTINTFTPNDVNFSVLDIYGVAFEQLNDTPFNVVETFDVNLLVTNVAGRFDGYLYSVIVDPITGRATVTDIASLNLGVPASANRYYRLRKGELGIELNGATDGIFAQLHYPTSPARIEDVSTKVWLNNPLG